MSDPFESNKESSEATVPPRKPAASESEPRSASPSNSALAQEIENLEKLFVEQFSKLKQRVAVGESIGAGASGKPALRDHAALASADTTSERSRPPENRLEARPSRVISPSIVGSNVPVPDRAIQASTGNAVSVNAHANASEVERNVAARVTQNPVALDELQRKVEDLESKANVQRSLLSQWDLEIREVKAQLRRLRLQARENDVAAAAAETTLANAVGSRTVESSDHQREESSPSNQSNEIVSVQVDEQVLSQDVVQKLTVELAEAMNIMEYLASLLIRRRAKAMGESIERFPTARFDELVALIAAEIADEDRRMSFRECFEKREFELDESPLSRLL